MIRLTSVRTAVGAIVTAGVAPWAIAGAVAQVTVLSSHESATA